MIPVSLSLANKKVVLIGGGHVSLRKAKQFLKEGAMVSIVSEELNEGFDGLDISYIRDTYKKDYIKDAFLVYACTDNKGVNSQVLLDCQQYNILAGSATYDSQASFYSMASTNIKDTQIALSTGQKFPYTKPVLAALEKAYEPFSQKMELLKQMRPYLLGHVEKVKDYYNLALECDSSILEFLNQAIALQKGSIFIYHPTDTMQNWQFDVEPSLVLTIEQYEQYRSLFEIGICFDIYPLVLFKGRILSKIEALIHPDFCLHPPFISDSQDIQFIIETLRDKNKQNIIITHNRTSSILLDMILQKYDYPIYDITENIDFKKENAYQVIVLLTEKGKHERALRENLEKLVKEGYDITIVGPMIDYPAILDYFVKRG